MKLHLSKSLRKAILATFAALVPLSLSLTTATAADTDSPREIKWDARWGGGDLYSWVNSYKPGFTKLEVRQVESGGLGWNNFDFKAYTVTLPLEEPDAQPATREVPAYAIAVNGVSNPNGALATYNTASGGSALQAPSVGDDIRVYSVFMDVSGTFEAVAGGDVYYSGQGWGTDQTSANRFISVREGSEVGVVSAFNISSKRLGPGGETIGYATSVDVWGSSFISVYTSDITDSVAGRSIAVSSTNYGDSNIFVYSVLSANTTTNIHIKGDAATDVIMWSSGNVYKPGCVAGGSYDAGRATIFGNSQVVVDLAGKEALSSFVKALAGGSCDISNHTQTGDAVVFIANSGGIAGYSAPIAGQSIYLIDSNLTGNSGVVITNSPTSFQSFVAGANYDDMSFLGSRTDVRMWAGNAQSTLTPRLKEVNDRLDALKSSYATAGFGTGGDTPAASAAATHADTLVYIDQASAGANFSKAVVGSNAVYTVAQNISNTDVSFVTTEELGVDLYLSDTNVPPSLDGIQSLSFLRTEDSRSIVWIDGGVYQELVVAGDYLYDADNVVGLRYEPSGIFRWYARHYNFRSSIGSTYLRTTDGTFRSTVQGGTYVYAQNYGGYWPTTAEGEQELLVALRIKDINMELRGGTFGAPEKTAVLGGYDVTDTLVSTMGNPNYLTSIVDAEVDTIYIQMGALDAAGEPIGKGVTVEGEIIGGSHIKACLARQRTGAAETYAIRQGSIWLRLLNGRFNGNVYGAGFYDSEKGKYDIITSPISTESVNVELSNKAEFGTIAICGSYKMSIASSSATYNLSVVFGEKKLSFTSAGVYNNLSKVEFADFSVVDVTEPTGYVTLNQPLQRLYSGIGADSRKTGLGTLAITNEHSSIASSFIVEGGTLALSANSNNYETGLVLNKLTVWKDATLDISAGSCGTRGRVILEGDSSLKVSSSQAPTLVTAVEIGTTSTTGKISIVSNALSDKQYKVRLFEGLGSTPDNVSVFGQALKPLSELGLNETEVTTLFGLDGTQSLGDVYAIRAESYVSLILDGKEVSMDNAYLVLYNGELSLATHIGREIAWKGENGDKWNYVNRLFVTGSNDEECYFRDGDTVHFVGNSGEEMTVVLDPWNHDSSNPDDHKDNNTLSPNSIVVGADSAGKSGSNFVFKSEEKGCHLDVKGSITVRNNSSLKVEKSAGLVTHADTTAIAVDNTSSLNIESDKVNIYTLNNGGDVEVTGSMLVNGHATSPGTLAVGKNLTLGSEVTNAQFRDLTVSENLSFAEGNTVTISGNATIGSANGGTLVINKGAAARNANRPATFSLAPLADTAEDGVTLRGTSTLKALQGAGTLRVVGNGSVLTLKSASTMGNLLADGPVVLYDSLHVDEELRAKSVKFASVGNGVITDEIVTAKMLNCEPFYMDKESVKDIHFVCDGDVYTLVKGETVSGTLRINDKDETRISNGRFLYRAYVEGNTIKIGVTNSFPNYYADHASTENGKAGAASLDSLFRPEIMSQIASNKNALASVIIAMDNMVGSDDAGADKLAAAAAGASNAALGCAFSDDVHRQLKAVRNRTTTMGCAECETREGMPTFNAWINAEGNYHKLESDGTFAGYTLSSWGGTVGVDADFTEHLTAGLVLTAMYGDYSADGPDISEGDLDTQYISLFARYAARAWVHTFVATFGRADVSLERTVSANGVAYSNKADTDGTGFGFMYEVGRVIAINEDATTCIEPIVNLTFTKSTLGGFTEQGTDAIVKTDDLEMTRFIIGAGARMQGIIGTTLYNRTSILEGRALLKANLGDNSCEAGNRFAIGGINGTYKSAEQGTVGFEVGIGVTVPVGGEGSSIFADCSADINAGYSNINGTIGYRVNF